MEDFLDIKNISGYKINRKSDIINKNGKILKQSIDNNGYCIVQINKKTYRVHRLVAECFIENKNNEFYINHIDMNKTNNSPENLEWCSKKYNTDMAKQNFILGRAVIQYDFEGNEIGRYRTIKEASCKTGCNQLLISKCINGKTISANGYIWKDILING